MYNRWYEGQTYWIVFYSAHLCWNFELLLFMWLVVMDDRINAREQGGATLLAKNALKTEKVDEHHLTDA